jgi:hypothetical protein
LAHRAPVRAVSGRSGLASRAIRPPKVARGLYAVQSGTLLAGAVHLC